MNAFCYSLYNLNLNMERDRNNSTFRMKENYWLKSKLDMLKGLVCPVGLLTKNSLSVKDPHMLYDKSILSLNVRTVYAHHM